MAERRLDEFTARPLELQEIVVSLEENKVEYIIIGGFAALAYGMPLPTYDLDIVLAPGKKNKKMLLRTMELIDAVALPDDQQLSAEESLEQGVDVSFATPHGYLDIVARPAGFDRYSMLHRNAQLIQIMGEVAPCIASLRDVVCSKREAGRARDQAQLPALEKLLEMSSET